MSSFKRSQSKYVKRSYKVRNWPEYDAGLRSRGSLTVWLGLDAAQTSVPGWDAKEPAKKKRGRQMIYSKHAIETTVLIGMVFRLPSRQNEGFMKSLFELLHLTNKLPDHTTLCCRKSKLGKVPLGASETGKPVHIQRIARLPVRAPPDAARHELVSRCC